MGALPTEGGSYDAFLSVRYSFHTSSDLTVNMAVPLPSVEDLERRGNDHYSFACPGGRMHLDKQRGDGTWKITLTPASNARIGMLILPHGAYAEKGWDIIEKMKQCVNDLTDGLSNAADFCAQFAPQQQGTKRKPSDEDSSRDITERRSKRPRRHDTLHKD